MQRPILSCHCARLLIALSGLAGFLPPQPLQAQLPVPPQKDYEPANGEFDFLGQAALDLLKSRATTNFAENFSVKAEDWRSVVTTNISRDEAERINTFAEGVGYNLQRLNAEAATVLTRADALHVDFFKGRPTFRVVAPRHVGNIYLGNPTTKSLTLPYVQKLEIFLFPGSEADQSTNNAFKLTVRGLEKFPGGWRIFDGIQWTGFPTNLADAKTLRELALAEKISAHTPVTAADDPALLKLSESLVSFVRTGDTNVFKKNLLLDSDTIWAMIQKSGQKGLTRQEVDKEVARQVQEQLTAAEKMVALMSATGMDLKKADIRIKDARMEHCQSQSQDGTLDGLIGEQFKLALAVKTDAKAKSGTPLSGDYVLAVQQIMKLGGEWKVVQDIHWEKLPEGVMDAQTSANIAFENHVAQYRTLPTGMAAPEIEFTTVGGGKKSKLFDFRGKIIVLDFWATWCGPCQEPMAELQKIREAHPDWQDKVAIVPVSIDDTVSIVRKHVNQRGWTNTFNVWAGEGGWHSAPAKAFRVTAVPTSYVIDPQGKIFWAGHAEANSISRAVDVQLKK